LGLFFADFNDTISSSCDGCTLSKFCYLNMNQPKQKTKQNKRSDVIAVVAVLAIAAMIFTTGTSYMISIQDVLAKNRNVPDLPLKIEECKHDTTIGPSCKNSENSESKDLTKHLIVGDSLTW
jgi:hypothetical protein